MAKLSRTALKGIVKECLVEILSEGLAPMTNLNESRGRRASPPRDRNESSRRPSLDMVSYAEEKTANPSFDNNVAQSVSTLTDDPIMGSIFADTAKTTLQEQIGNDRAGHSQQVGVHGDPAARASAASDPLDIFGESSSNWASLAFAEDKRR